MVGSRKIVLLTILSLGLCCFCSSPGWAKVWMRPKHLMRKLDIFRVEDLEAAADSLLNGAVQFDINVEWIPLQKTGGEEAHLADNVVRVWLPFREKVYNLDNRPEVVFSKEKTLTLIFVAKRHLSVGEIASLLRNRVRVLSSLNTFSGRDAFLVSVDKSSYGHLRKLPFFEFCDIYSSKDRTEAGKLSENEEKYAIIYFGYCSHDYYCDLVENGCKVESVNRPYHVIHVVGNGDAIRRVADLWWVAHIVKLKIAVSD